MRALKILHVEDSEDDWQLFGRACEVAGLPTELRWVSDGTEAVAYLEGGGKFTDRHEYPIPDLIVLDLTMPRMNGFDFLRWFKHESEFSLPVLVFTVSANVEDKKRALAEGAAGYFVKPKDFETLVRLTESFAKFKGDGYDKNDLAT